MEIVYSKQGVIYFRIEDEADFNSLEEGHLGFCVACGEEHSSCEPDAENYKCEYCGKDKVMGTATLLMMGRIV